MRKEEIEETINDFCVAVIRAMESGFEIVEVHGAGGYLISDFLSPRSNKRLDEYGLTIEGRMKFALDLMTAIKKTAKGRVLCGFRLMVDELVPGGVTFEDAVILAEALIKNSLVDYLNPLPGTHEAYINDQVAERLKEPGFGLNYSRVLKNLFPYAVVFGNWGIDTPEIAESAINARECDAVALARPLLADPDFPLKSREGREREIVRCQACYNCYYLALRGAEVKCKQWERKK
jgi:2,4-dienoyl-CoA reductase (NADPH2)